MTEAFVCPVCGFPGLSEPPWSGAAASDEICPSCGTHFGYDDAAGGRLADRARIYEKLRRAWAASGYSWFSRSKARPPSWDPIAQLRSIEGT
jgi:hypothetical protein